MLAFGPSSISEVNGAFVQNKHEVHDWAKTLEDGRLGVERGWEPTPTTTCGATLIMELFCQLELDTKALVAKR